MKEIVEWLRDFLASRSLKRPNGAMLFSYRVTRTEYLELRGLFAAELEQLRGAPWVPSSASVCACFVLYASEWWRREYNGGPWQPPNCNKPASEPSFRQTLLRARQTLFLRNNPPSLPAHHSTVTLFARLRGLSTSVPRAQAVW